MSDGNWVMSNENWVIKKSEPNRLLIFLTPVNHPSKGKKGKDLVTTILSQWRPFECKRSNLTKLMDYKKKN